MDALCESTAQHLLTSLKAASPDEPQVAQAVRDLVQGVHALLGLDQTKTLDKVALLSPLPSLFSSHPTIRAAWTNGEMGYFGPVSPDGRSVSTVFPDTPLLRFLLSPKTQIRS